MRIPPTLRHRRPSPALVVATLALFVALSGFAVALPGRNSVDSGDIKNDEVKSVDVKNGGLRSGDILDETLVGADVADDSLGSADVTNDSLTGGDIAQDQISGSEVFEPSLSEVPFALRARALGPDTVTIRTQSIVVPGGDQAASNGNGISRAVSVSCTNAEVAIGGGAFWSGNENSNSNDLENRLHTAAFNVNNSGMPTGYRARGEVDKDGDDTLTVQVACARMVFGG